MYNFNVFLLYVRLVPFFFRKPIFLAWLKVLAKPLQFVQSLLLTFTDKTEYDLLFNAQVVYLEHVLNDQFDNLLRRIYIENQFLNLAYLHNKIEVQPPLYVRNKIESEPVYFNNQTETLNAVNFIVYLPLTLMNQENEIINLINLYNLAGVNYELSFTL